MRLLFSSLLLALFLVGCSEKPALRDMHDATVKTGDWQGHWVIINYWAVWCEPCREEVPELNKLAKARPDVKIYGVSADGVQGAPLREQAGQLGIGFTVLQDDPIPVLGLPAVSALPTTYILNPRGNLQFTLRGPQSATTLLSALVLPEEEWK